MVSDRVAVEQKERMVTMLNEYGALVFVPERDDDPLQTVTTLNALLGTPVKHDREDEHGIVVLDPSNPTSINVAEPGKAHLPHTDDAYMAEPCDIMTLQCRIAAPEGTGLSTLVCGTTLLENISAAELAVLSKPGMIEAGRRPATPDAPWKFTSTLPTFWADGERFCLRWRCHDGCVKVRGRSARAVHPPRGARAMPEPRARAVGRR